MSDDEPEPQCPICGSLDYWYDHESEGWRCAECAHFEDETPEGRP